jgi:site-specific DNA recombinase
LGASYNLLRLTIEDQIRQGTRCADQNGWHIVMPYSDYAISGATRNREALQLLLQHASEGQFEIVITEGLDRLSRDQEDIAHIYKRLTFYGVKIYSLSDGGFVNEMHIGTAILASNKRNEILYLNNPHLFCGWPAQS